MTAPQGAVFLRYASEDAQAAQQICAKLRAAGVEVWFGRLSSGCSKWSLHSSSSKELVRPFPP